MESFKPVIAKVATGASLTREEARDAFNTLLSGEVTAAQGGAFLMALRVRGETVDELTGAVTAMREKMLAVQAPDGAIDIVGTGGDSSGSYNVSTLAAIIAAACGVPVAKHGNRAASSKSGTADALALLGVKLGIEPAKVAACVREAGLGFMFAPAHHASMRHVAPVRVELGTRTIFNLLGPLSNPANVKRHMIGAFGESWLEPMAQVLRALGSTHAWFVHGSDGLDEITVTGPTKIIELKDGAIRAFTVSPQDVGLPVANAADLKGGDGAHNAAALEAVLDGTKNAYRDIAVLNAAAGLLVGGKVATLQEGVAAAQAALDSGKAKATLAKLVAVSNG
ncbi:MAG: anthranilate phosphoribosyltransferase [Beijerinckiaceae bacterium]